MFKEIISQTWPEWTIVRYIGGGGYGSVYEVIRLQSGINDRAAIKVVSIPSSEAEIDSVRAYGLDELATKTHFEHTLQSCAKEIQYMLDLEGHPNIVNVRNYKIIEKKGGFGWYILILMELLTPFAVYSCDHILNEQEVIKLGLDICSALERCAQDAIIHRDIKPSNILVTKDNHFKLGDFGIACKLEAGRSGLSLRNTPKYGAPDSYMQLSDERVDIYSLGLVLYELLNEGCIPFLKKKQIIPIEDIVKAIATRNLGNEKMDPPCLASPAMADLILKACDRNPDNCFCSAKEMKQALMRVADGTYRIVAKDPDSKEFSDISIDSYNETKTVRKPSAVENDKFPPRPSTFGSVPKKNKKPILITAIIAFLIIVVAGSILLKNYVSIRQDIKAIIEDAEAFASVTDYEGAIDRIEAGLQEHGESVELQEKITEYQNSLVQQIAGIISNAESLIARDDLTGAVEILETALSEHPDADELVKKCEDYRTLINDRIDLIISEAESLAEVKDYESSLNIVQDGLLSYPESVVLQKKVDEYAKALNHQIKENTLSDAKKLADSGDYIAAMSLIKDAQDTYGDNIDYQSAFNTYRNAYKTEVVVSADTLSAIGDYIGALNTVRSALNIIEGDAELSAKAADYENKYVSGIIEKADRSLAEGDFDTAEDLVGEAKELFPNNKQLTEEATKIKNSRPVYLLNVTAPYETSESWYSKSDVISMGGKNYTHGFTCLGVGEGIYFNLDGKYSELSFTAGFVSIAEANRATLKIYADEELIYSFVMESSSLPKEHTVDIKSCRQLTIVIDDGWAMPFFSGKYGLAEIMVTPNI